MALPDIRHAGILAGVSLWGWPYHGVCSGGSIALSVGGSRAMAQPAHGAAWLYDLGLPPIVRTPDELAADAVLGHEWLNYAFISGGMIYGTQLSNRQFIHVDGDGIRWLLTVNFATPEISVQKVRLLITIERFGVLRQNGAGTSILIRQIDVQCSHIAKAAFAGTVYVATDVRLEDVWTNGNRALLGVYRSSDLTEGPGTRADMYALLEASISGSGGADGGDLVIDVAEIRADTELTYATQGTSEFDPTVTGIFPESSGTCPEWYDSERITPGTYTGVLWDRSWISMIGTSGGQRDHDREDVVSFAQAAHYDASGSPHVYRLRTGYRQKWTNVGASNSVSGSQCVGYYTDAACTGSTSVALDIEYGLTLLRDDTEIDAVKFVQHADCQQLFYLYIYGNFWGALPDPPPEPPTPSGWIASSWGSSGGGVYSKQVALFSPPVISGTLADALTIPPPPFSGQQSFSWSSPPLDAASVQAIYNAWRAGSRHAASGSAVVGGSDHVGVHRIDSKAAAFYLQTGGVRTYGTVHTPLGALSAGLPASADMFFAWNRKTAGYVFSAQAVCYV